MKQRINPITSLIAHADFEDSGQKMSIQDKIYKSMLINGSGNYEKIAADAGLKEAQVWKRLSELRDQGKIMDTGTTSALSSGKQGIVWATTEVKLIQGKLFS